MKQPKRKKVSVKAYAVLSGGGVLLDEGGTHNLRLPYRIYGSIVEARIQATIHEGVFVEATITYTPKRTSKK